MTVFFQLEPTDTFNILKSWHRIHTYICINEQFKHFRFICKRFHDLTNCVICAFLIMKLLTPTTWSPTCDSAEWNYIKCHFIDNQSPECLQNWAPQRSEPPACPPPLAWSPLIQSIKISIKSLGWSRLQTNDYLTTHTMRSHRKGVGILSWVD